MTILFNSKSTALNFASHNGGPQENAVLRGGRVTKISGETVSYSPELGLSAPVASSTGSSSPMGIARSLLKWTAAPVALFASASPAFAQDACVEVNPDEWVCEDNGAPATTEQVVTGTVQIEDGFEVDTSGVSGAAGLSITGNDVTVTQVSGISSINGQAAGIYAYNSSGVLSITASNASGVAGIRALNSAGGSDLEIDSTGGTVTGLNSGIRAENFGTGSLSILAGAVSGNGNVAIFARNSSAQTTDLSIDSTAGDVSGGRGAIYGSNNGTGILTITTANVSGADGYSAIQARNRGTDLLIDTTAGSVSGGTGIEANNLGSGLLSITTGDVTGSSNRGIDAEANGGGIIIDSSAGTVSGELVGIAAVETGAGAVSVTTGDVVGTGVSGIYAVSNGGGVSVDSSGGTVSGNGAGIVAFDAAGGSVAITSADITSNYSNAVRAFANAGDIVVDTSAGAVTSTYGAIFVSHQGAGAISVTTADVTSQSAYGGYGIAAISNEGSITIDSSAGTVNSGLGIYAATTGAGTISITTADVSQTSSSFFIDYAIVARSVDGDIAIDTSAGSVTASAAYSSGIYAEASGAGSISITTGDVTGTVNAVLVRNDGTGSTTITNNGSLSGGTWAILDDGSGTGPTTVSNNGTVTGAVSLGLGDDTIVNQASGLFLATADSDFGTGNDVFDNLGTVGVNGDVTLMELEQFNNTNLITMFDGVVDDSLTLPGGFAGGGELALDVDFNTGASDLLVLQGPVSGTTNILINETTTVSGFGQTALVVDAAAGVSANAFAISPTMPGASPFVAYLLEFDAANSDFLVSRALSPRVFEATKIAEAAQSLWYRSADAWADHRANARFAQSQAPTWLTFYGALANRDELLVDPTGFATGDALLDYEQDYFGVQGGLDFGSGDTLTYGITAGYLSSRLKFASNGNQADFDVFNLGASANYAEGNFFAEALLKYDFISGDLKDPTLGAFNGDADGKAYGARVNVGFRFGDEGFYFQPHGSIEYQESDLDDLVIGSQSFEIEEMDGLRGSAGVRVGGEDSQSNGSTIGYYLDASAVHEFEGENATTFVIGTDRVSFNNNPIDTYAHIEAGLTLDGTGPLSGFFQVEADVSGDYTSFGGRLGIRVPF